MGAPPDTIERIILEFDQPQTISRLVYEVEEPARDGPRKSALKSRKTVIQAASDAGNVAGLVFFVFDLLPLDGDDVSAQPLIERKARLAALLSNIAPTAIPTEGWFMSVASAPASSRRSWSGCGNGYNRLLPPRCRSMSHRLEPTALDHHWSSVACIGCGPSWSPRSSF
jgi:hypothetical protein